VDAALILSRLAQFAAAFAVFGSAAFRAYALAGDPAVRTLALVGFDVWYRRVALGGALLALLSALAWLVATTADMAGSAAAAIDPGTIAGVLFETAFGRAWCWHLLIAGLLLGVCIRWRGRGHHGAVLVLSLLLLTSLGWVGHASMDSGSRGIAHELNQMVHLLAGGLWLGGLFPLAWLLRHVRQARDPAWLALACDAIPRFSQVGYAAVALLALSGAINTALLVGHPEGLVGTPYGRLLTVKIALFLAMMVLALINRLRLLPRLRMQPPASARAATALARSVIAEQALGVAILGVVSVLGTWPPAVHAGMATASGRPNLIVAEHPMDHKRK